MNKEKRYIIFVETVNIAKKMVTVTRQKKKKNEKTITMEDKRFGTR